MQNKKKYNSRVCILDDVDWMQPKHLPLEAKKVLAERIQNKIINLVLV